MWSLSPSHWIGHDPIWMLTSPLYEMIYYISIKSIKPYKTHSFHHDFILEYTNLSKESFQFLWGNSKATPASPCHPQGRRWRCRGHRCPLPGDPFPPYSGWASEILHQLIGGKHPIILCGFQPSKVVHDFATIHSMTPNIANMLDTRQTTHEGSSHQTVLGLTDFHRRSAKVPSSGDPS